MPMELKITIESNPPPLPIIEYRGGRKRTIYPFGDIPVGASARFPRGIDAVRKKLTEHRKKHPTHKFIVRRISPTITRVWRTA